MKVGWVKYNGTIEIGRHLLGTAGTTVMRTGFFEVLLQNGVDLRLYTYLSGDTRKFLKSEEGKKKFSKMKVFEGAQRIHDDIDVLVVENGPTNTSFVLPKKGIPCIANAYRLLSTYKGLVFYFQIDVALPFVFYPEFYSRSYVNDFLKYGGFKAATEGKKYVMITTGTNIDEFAETSNTLRYPYRKLIDAGAIEVERLELHYCCIRWGEGWKIVKNPRKVLLYIGGEKSRITKFKEFYDEPSQNGVPTLVFGKWSERRMKEMPTIKWKGVLEKGGTLQQYNDSLASVIIGNKVYERMGVVTGRFFEVICAKTLPLIDRDLAYTTSVAEVLEEPLLKKLVVSSSDSVVKKFNKAKEPAYRMELVKACVQGLKQHSSQEVYEEFVRLVKKHAKRRPENDAFVTVFEEMIEGRLQAKDFSSRVGGDFIRLFYFLNEGEPYVLGKETTPIEIDDSPRCYKCGELHVGKKFESRTKFASRVMCDNCKEGKFVWKQALFNYNMAHIQMMRAMK